MKIGWGPAFVMRMLRLDSGANDARSRGAAVASNTSSVFRASTVGPAKGIFHGNQGWML